MAVKFLDLAKVNLEYQDEIEDKLLEVYRKGWYIKGKEVEQFETSLASYCSTKYALGVGNGYDALSIILKAYLELGLLKKGDEVLVPANTFIATVLSVLDNDLVPVFIDVSYFSYNFDLDSLKQYHRKSTKALIAVHLYGAISLDEAAICYCKSEGILIIEDNAQAIGAVVGNKKTGALGDAAAFSFYPGKNLGALGDGGAIASDNKDLIEVATSIANYGSKEKYHHEYIGVNSRLDEIQAAILNVKLKYIDDSNARRRDVAQTYIDYMKNELIVMPSLPKNEMEHVWHLFVVKVENRSHVQKYFASNDIETLVHYPTAAHLHTAFKNTYSSQMKIAERLQHEVLSLPISPVMTAAEIAKVIDVANKYSPE